MGKPKIWQRAILRLFEYYRGQKFVNIRGSDKAIRTNPSNVRLARADNLSFVHGDERKSTRPVRLRFT